ncbi:unnamed protein product [marine sediment metagenome]|uniref:DUF2335 domain-containing protein n=1 Tax=marine sediment metagenome TaxID=412755 RepID=X0V8N3_9ZZZZ
MARKHKISPKAKIQPDQIKKQVLRVMRAEYFQGPMPQPDDLEKYEKLYPGASRLLFTLLEKQADHRINLEKSVVASNIINEKIGQRFAFIICVTVIIGGIALSILDKSITGFGSILSALGTIVTIFIVGKRRIRKELDEKR